MCTRPFYPRFYICSSIKHDGSLTPFLSFLFSPDTGTLNAFIHRVSRECFYVRSHSITLAVPTELSRQISGTPEHLGLVKETALITLLLNRAKKLNTLLDFFLSPLSSGRTNVSRLRRPLSLSLRSFVAPIDPNWIEQSAMPGSGIKKEFR